MKRAEHSELKRQVAQHVLDLISQHDDVLGPVECTIHDNLNDCDDDCDLQPAGTVFTRQVEGFFLTIGYTGGRNEDETFIATIVPKGQSAIYTSGLVRYANNDWE